MTAMAGSGARSETATPVVLDRAAGLELLGPVHGSGYRRGVCLVRRDDGQVVQLGPLMYGLLEVVDGRRGPGALAEAMSAAIGRRVDEEQVLRIADKLAEKGLLAGTEHVAPPRRNPLLALRWKVLVTDPAVTGRLVRPLTFLFRPVLMWPLLVVFAAVCWFVLVDKGLAGATAQAFHSPGLLLLVFVLAVLSAGFHELGHAAACRYSGATPGGMGAGIYLVWPAFYTDVTDAYRLPRRDRLRIDLAGLYFNAVVADATMLVWLFWRVDALLLLVALQLLQMAKQLSPVIRADGYHILSDATGVPDLFAHVGPTLRRLVPGRRREPAALAGWARLLVTVWVLVVVPVLASLAIGAVLLLPRLATTAWDSGRHLVDGIPSDAAHFELVRLGATLLQMVALVLPVAGSVLVSQKILRTTVRKARDWSEGRPERRGALLVLSAVAAAVAAWSLWPSGQYQPVRAQDRGTLSGLVHLVDRPAAARFAPPTGTRLAVAMIPVGGPTAAHPDVFFLPRSGASAPVAFVGTGSAGTAVAFPFALPGPPGPHGTQAVAINTTDGGVTYDVAYALITVGGHEPVDETNAAYAVADCRSCTTVAVSFQVVLVVGQAHDVAPVDAAGAINYRCPACSTTAIADQMVVTLEAQPTAQLVSQIDAALHRLGQVSSLGSGATPSAIAAAVGSVETQISGALAASGLVSGQTTMTTLAGGTGESTATTTVPPSTAYAPTSSTSDTSSTTTTVPSSTSTGSSTTTTAPSTTTTSTTVAP
jgi:putative peptide zinc metalloprotease protein